MLYPSYVHINARRFQAQTAPESKIDDPKDEPSDGPKEEPAKEEPAKEEPAKEEPPKEEPVKKEPAKEESPKEEPPKDASKPESAAESEVRQKIIRQATSHMRLRGEWGKVSCGKEVSCKRLRTKTRYTIQENRKQTNNKKLFGSHRRCQRQKP